MAYSSMTFSSSDPGVSEQWLADVYGAVALDRGFGRFSQRIAGDEDFFVARSHWDGVMGSTVEMDWVVIINALAPSPWESRDGDGDLAAAPALFRPGIPFSACSDQGTQLAAFDPRALQRTARLLYADDDLTVAFDGAEPVNPQAGAQWLAVLGLIQGDVDVGLLDNELVRASASRLLKVAALECFRLTGDRHERHVSAERRMQVYRVGVEFLHEFASLPITVEDAADAAGASVPDLVDAFRAHHPQAASPAAALRHARLAAAYDDLLAGDPTRGDTVRDISLRWGFSSPSRFAAWFRAAYGVSPKYVLDR
ncbi:helix-turn-helix domain-containing protein [Microbacterium mangrovi]|uniref:helix-turn-helix domain-containing protein n=1 Tax=Microbacterium mangrovi TaxID=1348253 RepID=UPI00068B2998|nr:AraC family transcriptional regulator [Microbacterium mangrovi]